VRKKRTNARTPRSRRERNNRTTYAVIGDWNVQSDLSGRVFKRSECRYTWDNYLVHTSEWYEKQPQLTILTPKDKIAVPDARVAGEIFEDNVSDGSDMPWPNA
jgi:hypothetical protein